MTAILDYIVRTLSFFWLTGPVFDKELRVSSRKRRNYVLRAAYILLMLIILLFIWAVVVDFRGSRILNVSRLAQAGKVIVTYIVVFQFCASQIIAVVMLSNSISDEIYHKTLGMLMTTPITSMQIVIGKMFSKLLQLFLLLAISLPLLAIVRVFGGVPWSFITSSLCLTLTTVILVSSISLFYSIFCRRAHIVIIVTILSILCLFALIPFLAATIFFLTKIGSDDVFGMLLINTNPYVAFFFNTLAMLEPRAAFFSFFVSPYINCLINLLLAFVFVVISIILVRKVALRQAAGQLFSSRQKKTYRKNNAKNSAIISVIGPAVLWKELILPLRKNTKILRIIGVIVFLAILTYSYWFLYHVDALDDEPTHVLYSLIFMVLGTLITTVFSSTSITLEKESSSWLLLLTSTLSDRQIVYGKLCGVISRCLPVWSLLVGHFILFYFLGFIHPIAILLTVILLVWFIILISCSGLYFSSRFKHTTSAVVMNFVFILFIWALIPVVLGIFGEIIGGHDAAEVCFFFNPFIQIIVIAISTITTQFRIRNGIMQYDWPSGYETLHTTLIVFGISFFAYIILALIFLWRTKKRIRNKIF
ncbi:MAG: ABC transporter permease subunit [Sedimentisphaerales bacterium]|nr:ABC transporter permease subunit [Sedimentisphaerales bacterium]